MSGLGTIPFRRTITVLVVLMLAAPTVLVVVSSFGASRQIVFPPNGLSLQWYDDVLSNGATWRTLGNTLFVSVVAALVTVVVGVPAAIGLSRIRGRSRVALTVVLSAGLSAPPVIAAFGFYDVFSRVDLGGLAVLGLALGIVNFPFMLWAVSSAVENEDPELMSAAATLGADPVERFLFVRLPLIGPGIMTGTLLVFILSATDFVVSQVLTSVDNQTLPVYVYSSLRATISPSLGASSSIFIVVAAVVLVLVIRFGKMERFLFRGGS